MFSAGLIEEAESTHEMVSITRHGRPSVVLMAADDLESLQAGLIEAVQRIRTLAEDYGVANP
jgi:prevent-host-death family protein